MKKLIIDPPSGWKYGFPKPIPQHIIGNDAKLWNWLLKQGYPAKDLQLAIKHSRYWEA